MRTTGERKGGNDRKKETKMETVKDIVERLVKIYGTMTAAGDGVEQRFRTRVADAKLLAKNRRTLRR